MAKGSNTITTLISFNNGTNGSVYPSSLIMDSHGDLYGTTWSGGASDDGTVFELAKGSRIITILASFNNGTNVFSVFPSSLIMDSDGNLYGTTGGGGFDGQGTIFELQTSTNGNMAPVITTEPSNQTVAAGQTVTFTAAASGNPTPTVQWQVSTDGGISWTSLSNGTNISGATTGTLTISNVTAAMNGYEFEAVFTNSAGSATTNAATLTVNAPVQPPPQPVPQTKEPKPEPHP